MRARRTPKNGWTAFPFRVASVGECPQTGLSVRTVQFNTIHHLFTAASSQPSPDDAYLDKMDTILRCAGSTAPPTPSQILRHLYIGSDKNTYDETLMRDLGITHVLNCAGVCFEAQGNKERLRRLGIEYDQFEAEDASGYNIMRHFSQAKSFIEGARLTGGRVLVVCTMGVNRSGAMCVAYLMLHDNMNLLEAVKFVSSRRTLLLVNLGFRKQLLDFARDKELLGEEHSCANTKSISEIEDRNLALQNGIRSRYTRSQTTKIRPWQYRLTFAVDDPKPAKYGHLNGYLNGTKADSDGHGKGSVNDEVDDYLNGNRSTKANGYTYGNKSSHANGYIDGNKSTKANDYLDGNKFTKAKGYTYGNKSTMPNGYIDGNKCTKANGYTDGNKSTMSNGYTYGNKSTMPNGYTYGNKSTNADDYTDGNKSSKANGYISGTKVGKEVNGYLSAIKTPTKDYLQKAKHVHISTKGNGPSTRSYLDAYTGHLSRQPSSQFRSSKSAAHLRGCTGGLSNGYARYSRSMFDLNMYNLDNDFD